jgi:hypothetical protein
MESGDLGNAINPWGVALFQTLESTRPANAAQEAAYSKWLDQTSAREEARLDRVHGAEGIIPTPVWIVLFLSAAVIFGFMLFFADGSERAYVQALQIGAVVAVLGSMFVVLRLLDEPYHPGVGGLQPVAMERTLEVIEEALRAVDRTTRVPCDEAGTRVGS